MRNDILWLWLGIRGEFRGNRCAREKSRGWNLGDVAQKCDIYGEKVRENNCTLNDLGIYLIGQTSPLQVTVYSYINTIFVIYLFRLIINIPGDVDDNCGNPFSWNMFLPRSPNPLIPFQLLQTFEVFILTRVLKFTLRGRSVIWERWLRTIPSHIVFLIYISFGQPKKFQGHSGRIILDQFYPHLTWYAQKNARTPSPSLCRSWQLGPRMPSPSFCLIARPEFAANHEPRPTIVQKKCVLQQKVPKTTVNRHWYSDLKLLADEIFPFPIL